MKRIIEITMLILETAMWFGVGLMLWVIIRNCDLLLDFVLPK